jgi:hypothetical protein
MPFGPVAMRIPAIPSHNNEGNDLASLGFCGRGLSPEAFLSGKQGVIGDLRTKRRG